MNPYFRILTLTSFLWLSCVGLPLQNTVTHARPPADINCVENSPSTMDEGTLRALAPLTEIPEAILAITSKLDALTPKCADKIWPSSGVGTYQVILVDPITKQPWLWTPKGFKNAKDPGGLERLDPKELEKNKDVFQSRYSFNQFRGRNTVSLLLNQRAFRTFEEELQEVEKQKKSGRVPKDFELTKELYLQNKANSIDVDFTTVVHESFHAYGQGTHHPNDGHHHPWKVIQDQEKEISEGVMNRYSDYPLEAGPRYFRRMQFETMLKAVNSKDPQQKEKLLAEAAHWQKKYEESGGEHERTNGSDISEGTAKYFDFMASIYAKHGCELSKEETQKKIEESLAKLVSQMEKNGGLPPVADVESYNIGLLSNLLLAQLEDSSDWKKQLMTERETPAEILLEGYTPTKANDDAKILGAIEEVQAKENKQLQGLMDGLSSHAKNKEEWVRLELPTNSGAYNHKGYYKNTDVSDGVLAVSASKKYALDDLSLEIENVSIIMEKNSPCPAKKGSSNQFIFVPKSSIQSKEDQIEFEFTDPQTALINAKGEPLVPKAKGNGSYSPRKGTDGTEWYCLE